jgi:ABC-type transporter lipoprotein component MlaA
MRTASWSLAGISALGTYEASMDLIGDARKSSLDFYAYARSLYRQHRKKQIDEAKGVKPDEHSPAYDFSFDEEEDF